MAVSSNTSSENGSATDYIHAAGASKDNDHIAGSKSTCDNKWLVHVFHYVTELHPRLDSKDYVGANIYFDFQVLNTFLIRDAQRSISPYTDSGCKSYQLFPTFHGYHNPP